MMQRLSWFLLLGWIISFSLKAQTSVEADRSPTKEREPREGSSALRRIVRNLEQKGFFGPQTLPNSPRPAKELIPEWAPADAALLSIQSLPAVLGLSATLSQYKQLIAALLPITDVIVLYPEKEQTLLGELIQRLEMDPAILTYQDRLSFVSAPGPTMWLRDNGPAFALNAQNAIALYDFTARPFVDEEELWYTTPSELTGVEWEQETNAFIANRTRERIADATPVALARHLSLRVGSPLVVNRPPISLQGGDFINDGKGNFFISHDTLQANGGDAEALQSAFRRYVANAKLHFLFPLPGNTPKHLDMVMKFVDSDTVLVASPPPAPTGRESSYRRRLRFEIESSLAFNRRYLEREFPQIRIIEVPLLPVLDEAPVRILNRIRWRIFAKACEIHQLKVLNLLRGDTESEEFITTQAALLGAIEKDLGTPNKLETIDELQQAALHYLQTDVHNLVEVNVPFQTIFRSPVNALHLVTAKGQEHFILPRFAPREEESVSSMQKWEHRVQKAYLEARPRAKITWVAGDVAAELQGGLHCMSITLPRAPQADNNKD